jgi:biopolymer transport protein ExbD
MMAGMRVRGATFVICLGLVAPACGGRSPETASTPRPATAAQPAGAEEAAPAGAPQPSAGQAPATGSEEAIEMQLPSGESREIDPGRSSVVVELRKDERRVNGSPVTDADLDRLFRDAFARDRETQVILRPQSDVPHARVVDVIERAKAAGLTRMAIADAAAD